MLYSCFKHKQLKSSNKFLERSFKFNSAWWEKKNHKLQVRPKYQSLLVGFGIAISCFSVFNQVWALCVWVKQREGGRRVGAPPPCQSVTLPTNWEHIVILYSLSFDWRPSSCPVKSRASNMSSRDMRPLSSEVKVQAAQAHLSSLILRTKLILSRGLGGWGALKVSFRV